MRKLKKVILRNFRCFERLEVDLHERLTVIVAPNGGGKSTILDAVAQVLSVFVGRFGDKMWQAVRNDDTRVVRKEDGTRTMVMPSTIAVTLDVDGQPQEWGRCLTGIDGQHVPQLELAMEYGDKLLDVLRSEQPSTAVTLPVVAYYGSKRTVAMEKYTVSFGEGNAALMREQGYANCLTGNANVNIFRTWYGKAAFAESKVQHMLGQQPVAPADKQLALRSRAVKETVNQVLSGSSKDWRYWLDYFPALDMVGVLDTEQKVELGLQQLSDGVQCMISLAGDLAARCAVLNPQFGADAPKQTPGIVMIDEIDLHLHPSWQQRVLPDLMRAFPNTQFIVTTHSPQVLSTVRKEHIRILTASGTVISPEDGTYGAESSRILEEVFCVHSRPQGIDTVKDLRAYLALVEAGKAKAPEAVSLREQLNLSLGKHDPDLLTADIRASQLEVLGRR